MVPEPIIYLKTVDILMNEIEKGLKKLDSVLTPQTILIVSVTASTTSGKVLAHILSIFPVKLYF